MSMTDGCWYTSGKYYSAYYHNIPREYELLRDESGKAIEAWTGDSRSPKYRQVYCHPKHFEQARAEVRAHNTKMLAESNSFYAQPWV